MENKKELSLNDIAELIKVSADETKKTLEAKIDASTEELATMTQKHFLRIEGNMEKGFKKVNEDLGELRASIENVEADLNKKVDVFTHNELEYRVEKLEKKVGLVAA